MVSFISKRKFKKLLNIKNIYSKVQSLLFNKLPKSVGRPLALLLALAPILLIGLAYYLGSNKHPSSVTVMITDLDQKGGGSGVVVSTSASESLILTNKHVCEGSLSGGGKIRLVSGQDIIVDKFLLDDMHDLCLISVFEDLKSSVKIAKSAPKIYSKSVVTGHPALMPNVISEGHFGGKEIIAVLTGIKKCKQEDFEKPKRAPYCVFFGAYPIIEFLQAQLVSSTIMPGSSGSAVLNSNGELSGLVFAGRGRGLTYGFIVPYEYVINFLKTAPKKLSTMTKQESFSALQNEEDVPEQMKLNIKKTCESLSVAPESSNQDISEKVQNFCNLFLKEDAIN